MRSTSTISHIAIPLLCGLALFAAPASAFAQSDARSKANALLVEAISKAEAASQADDPGRRVELLDRARSLLRQIRNEYASTDLAVKLATGQQIGDFDPKKLRDRYESALGQVCLEDPEPECLKPLAAYANKTQRQLEERTKTLDQAHAALASQKKELEGQIEDLESRARRLENSLQDAKSRAREGEQTVSELKSRFESVLKSGWRRIPRYRDVLFDRLSDALEGSTKTEIAEGRFILHAAGMFAIGSADLTDSGAGHAEAVAKVLKGFVSDMPDNVDWVIRIDGHTDRQPIDTERFPSNWELSTARANAFVHELIDHRVPAYHLASGGYAEQRPLVTGDTDEARAQNRRIEITLHAPGGVPNPEGEPPEDVSVDALRAEDIIRGVLDQLQRGTSGAGGSEGVDSSLRNSKAATDKRLTSGQIDAIRQQLASCWSPPAGTDGETVEIMATFDRDGAVRTVEPVSSYRMDGGFYEALAESAMRAVRICSPLAGLPTDKYSEWRKLRLTFDAEEMLGE